MLHPILFKEFLKTWKPLLLALAGNLAVCAYVFLETRALFRREHPEMVWRQVMELGLLFYGALEYVPLLTGAAIAVMQFLPEMRRERLRLSLHLPVDPALLLLAHLAAGLGGLAICLAVQAAALALTALHWLPRETLVQAFGVWAGWALAGGVGYLGAALVLLEPALPRRIANLALAAGLAGLFFWPASRPALRAALPWLALSLPLLLLAVLHPAYRYRNRRIG